MSPSSLIAGRILTSSGLETDTVMEFEAGRITGLGARIGRARAWDASDLLVLPGIIDLHGDAFERQLMPRPGVHFDAQLALVDTDRQLIANGITTAFHAVTYSWEPGLRGKEAGRRFLAALEALRPDLACNTRLHLRWETYNLDVEEEVTAWLEAGSVGLLAFNDHTPEIVRQAARSDAMSKYTERSGLAAEDFRTLVLRVAAREAAVPAAIERLAAAALKAAVPMAAHDEQTPEERRWFHRIGCRISEFPKNEATASAAVAAGDAIVMGAPNVVRGGSHLSAVSAAHMVAHGLCSVLTSDYYYPAQLHAAFRLARDGVCKLDEAWRLIAENPSRAAGLEDRGVLAPGKRADFILVDDSRPGLPRVVASFVAGKPVFFAEDRFRPTA